MCCFGVYEVYVECGVWCGGVFDWCLFVYVGVVSGVHACLSMSCSTLPFSLSLPLTHPHPTLFLSQQIQR